MSEHNQTATEKQTAQIQVTEADLKADLRRLKLELGHTPSYGDYDEHGKYSFSPIRRAFGCWSAALDAVAFDQADRPRGAKTWEKYTDAELLESLQELADELGKPPSARDMNDHGSHSNQLYYDRFGSWNAALAEAGLERSENWVSPGALIDDILAVACEVGRSPFMRELNESGEYSAKACKEKFGSWAEALQAAGLPPRYRGGTNTRHPSPESYGRNWDKMRRRALERDRYECQDCGTEYADEKERTGTGLHVHHICPIRAFDEPEQANFLQNLITLCEGCHRLWERSGPSKEEIDEIVAAATGGPRDE